MDSPRLFHISEDQFVYFNDVYKILLSSILLPIVVPVFFVYALAAVSNFIGINICSTSLGLFSFLCMSGLFLGFQKFDALITKIIEKRLNKRNSVVTDGKPDSLRFSKRLFEKKQKSLLM
jgi:hypothetical protein